MSYINWKIEREPFISNEWLAVSTEEISSFRSPSIIANTGSGRDTFTFTITNFNNEFDLTFQPNDKIYLYRILNSSTTTTDDLEMVATVRDSKDKYDGKNNELVITGYNYSETLLNAIVFINPINKTPAEIIKQGLDYLNAKNDNFGIEWHPSNDTEIASLTFPTYSEKLFNQSMKFIIEKYSTNTKTGNGNFYWYIDRNNFLVWRQESTNVDYNFDSSSDGDLLSLSTEKDISQVKNFFILKGGYDPAGHQIQETYQDWGSIARHSVKFKLVISENNTAKQLIDSDIKQSYGSVPSPDGYPNITSSSFTTSWNSNVEDYTVDGINVTKNNPVVINKGSEADNRDSYVAVVREEIRRRLKVEGKDRAENLRYGKLKTVLTFKPGAKVWGLGDLINVNIPKISITNTALRVVEIQKTTEADVYSLVEDIGTL